MPRTVVIIMIYVPWGEKCGSRCSGERGSGGFGMAETMDTLLPVRALKNSTSMGLLSHS